MGERAHPALRGAGGLIVTARSCDVRLGAQGRRASDEYVPLPDAPDLDDDDGDIDEPVPINLDAKSAVSTCGLAVDTLIRSKTSSMCDGGSVAPS